MIYNGKEEILFEDDAVMVDACSKCLAIQQHIDKEKLPPHETQFIAFFKDWYKIGLKTEEIQALRDFIESGEFDTWQKDRIQSDRMLGMEDVDLRDI